MISQEKSFATIYRGNSGVLLDRQATEFGTSSMFEVGDTTRLTQVVAINNRNREIDSVIFDLTSDKGCYVSNVRYPSKKEAITWNLEYAEFLDSKKAKKAIGYERPSHVMTTAYAKSVTRRLANNSTKKFTIWVRRDDLFEKSIVQRESGRVVSIGQYICIDEADVKHGIDAIRAELVSITYTRRGNGFWHVKELLQSDKLLKVRIECDAVGLAFETWQKLPDVVTYEYAK